MHIERWNLISFCNQLVNVSAARQQADERSLALQKNRGLRVLVFNQRRISHELDRVSEALMNMQQYRSAFQQTSLPELPWSRFPPPSIFRPAAFKIALLQPYQRQI